jgi:hypothetical protein
MLLRKFHKTKGKRERERESIAEHMRDLGPRHLLINSKLSLAKRPKLFLCIGSIIMCVSRYSTEKHLLRSFVASSPLCDPILVEIKCAYGRRNTVVLRRPYAHLISTSNCLGITAYVSSIK